MIDFIADEPDRELCDGSEEYVPSEEQDEQAVGGQHEKPDGELDGALTNAHEPGLEIIGTQRDLFQKAFDWILELRQADNRLKVATEELEKRIEEASNNPSTSPRGTSPRPQLELASSHAKRKSCCLEPHRPRKKRSMSIQARRASWLRTRNPTAATPCTGRRFRPNRAKKALPTSFDDIESQSDDVIMAVTREEKTAQGSGNTSELTGPAIQTNEIAGSTGFHSSSSWSPEPDGSREAAPMTDFGPDLLEADPLAATSIWASSVSLEQESSNEGDIAEWDTLEPTDSPPQVTSESTGQQEVATSTWLGTFHRKIFGL
ncbi:hypothetical protein B0T14DRAFT_263549 [Immersiella caudata]|uniref:Uncharacterized protein n=1 Tax=Immersiella caudata TaxID=314043 RepID=A0AA40BXJ2_9PEZI|nr:hypothetical protein B0T14DRAFT_263549 [Immersiella caudata]